MKTTTNNSWNQGIDYKINMREEATAVFKTILHFETAYATSYLARVLKGDDRFGLRKDAHRSLETFGELEDMSRLRIEKLIHYLIKTAYIQVKDLRYGTLSITDKAVTFLKESDSLEVDAQELRSSWHEVELNIQLKQLRKKLSEAADISAHLIFSNFTMQQLIDSKPESMETIRQIPGCKKLSDSQANAIIDIVQDMQQKIERDKVDGTFRKVYSASHRKTKSMHLEGKSIGDMAESLDVKPSKIKEYLSNLHRAAELDLSEWIEEQVGPQELHRGTEYFKQAESPLLKEAHEVLGMDYDKLHMCRAYVTRAQEEGVDYALAS